MSTTIATPITPSASAPPISGTFILLFFASASDYTDTESLTLTAPLPLSQLYGVLEAKYPGITQKVLKGCAITVNLEYVDVPGAGSGQGASAGEGPDGEAKDLVIQAGDEVGIIPPVSSG